MADERDTTERDVREREVYREVDRTSSSTGWIIGLIIILIIILLLIFGLPGATTEDSDGEIETDIPNEFDINVNTPDLGGDTNTEAQ